MSDDGIQAWAPMEVVEALLARAEKAEAAIERVRDVCADQRIWAEYGPDADLVDAVTVESIFTALDGGLPKNGDPVANRVESEMESGQ